MKTPWVQEELSGLVSEALGLQLLRVLEAQGKQLEMLLGHELGVRRGMVWEVLPAGGDGGFSQRTFPGDCVRAERRLDKALLVW